MTFQITILGSGSAAPTLRNFPSAQVLELGNEYFLIDCGEGTQYRLLERRIRPGRLKGIFITHLHGDHYFGLFGLLTSLSLGQRTDDLYLFGPHGLGDILREVFRQSDTRLSYLLHFKGIDAAATSIIYETPLFTVSAFPLRHRISCTGFLFKEKEGSRKLIKEKLTSEMTHEHFRILKQGQDIVDNSGNILYSYLDYTLAPDLPRSYAYCSDTVYLPALAEFLQGVDWIYHEATFRDDQHERAAKTFHSTAKQAATVAKNAGASKLLIGHFSSRYHETLTSVEEARTIFPETYFAEEGQSFEIPVR